jgi:hypothetical protein
MQKKVEMLCRQTMMKIRGPLVDMLVNSDTELYAPHVVQENNGNALYAQLLKTLYGTLQAALIFYKKLK